ncbi:hypothetical protein HMPREF0072_0984 [Anaerococcus lactolyticus ATCC 51172]|uniref:Inosine/uridine-preferring nucleoside hydrolase domain-containing protein n=2 Tax=Anaerococcus lactolyticus TaxID=33032 RepID=C2BF64_9FIRM|nr:hypothetical protein [Anaerococcus lactolyticus]EEI86462.1 hypothetical protein HMPREF0072_0984 [Anaerococcus lactolyticus ATCC 51172]
MEYQKPFIYIDTNFSPADGLFIKMALDSFDFELVGLSANRSYMSSAAAGENILGLVNSEDLFLSVAKNFDDKKSKLDEEIFIPEADYLEDMDAYENLYDLASDCGRLDIIASGDLANIAKACREFEDFTDFIDHIFLSIPDLKSLTKEELTDLDLILSSGINIFVIDKKFADNFILEEKDLENILKNHPQMEKLLKTYDQEALTGALLLYLSQRPEAFIFEEAGLKVNFDEKSLESSEARPKIYMVNKVNEESFYDYLRAILCK